MLREHNTLSANKEMCILYKIKHEIEIIISNSYDAHETVMK